MTREQEPGSRVDPSRWIEQVRVLLARKSHSDGVQLENGRPWGVLVKRVGKNRFTFANHLFAPKLRMALIKTTVSMEVALKSIQCCILSLSGIPFVSQKRKYQKCMVIKSHRQNEGYL